MIFVPPALLTLKKLIRGCKCHFPPPRSNKVDAYLMSTFCKVVYYHFLLSAAWVSDYTSIFTLQNPFQISHRKHRSVPDSVFFWLDLYRSFIICLSSIHPVCSVWDLSLLFMWMHNVIPEVTWDAHSDVKGQDKNNNKKIKTLWSLFIWWVCIFPVSAPLK